MKDTTKLALLEQSIGHTDESLIRIEKRFDKIDLHFDRMDKQFCNIDSTMWRIDTKFNQKIDTVNQEIKDFREQSWSQFRWIMGSILTLFGSFIVALIKRHVV